MPNSRHDPSHDSGESSEPSPVNASDEELLSEIEALEEQVRQLLAADDLNDHAVKRRDAGGARINRSKETQVAKTELEAHVEQLRERIDRLEASQRQHIIRKAARFAADVLVARGRAPLGWDGESRCVFEEELGKHLRAELTELDQDEANARALELMELAAPQPEAS